MDKTKKRNAITRTNQLLQNARQRKQQRQQPPIIEPIIPPIQAIAPPTTMQPSKRKGWTRSKIKIALKLLQDPQTMVQNKFDLVQNRLAEYERNKVSSRKSSQTYGAILSRLKEEYQTNTDLNTLIASIPITEDQYEEVKQRCQRDYQQSVLSHLRFLMDLHKKTMDLETTIENAISSDLIDVVLENIGAYENALYANDKKVEKFNQAIRKMLKTKIHSEEAIKMYKEIDDLVKRNLGKDELLRFMRLFNVDKIPDKLEKEYIMKAIDYIVLTCSQIMEVATADAELQQLLKKMRDEKSQKRISYDKLENKITAYQSLPGPKDPKLLKQAITDQQSQEKKRIIYEKIKEFTDYIESKPKLQREDLVFLEALFADISSYESEQKPPDTFLQPIIELRRRMLEIIRNELNFEQEILVQEENTITNQSSSVSIPEEQNNRTLAFHQQTPTRIRDKLVSQEIGDQIPILIVHMHGIVVYEDDEMRCRPDPIGFDVLYRFINAAPYETNQARVSDPKIHNLLGNTILCDSKSTIEEVFEEAKEKLYETASFDLTRFRTFKNHTDYGATVDKKKRSHFIINYKGSHVCRKLWELDYNDVIMRSKMGIFLVNQPSPSYQMNAGLNLLEDPQFVQYLKTYGKGVKYETTNGKECITRVASMFVYDYLYRKGFRQVILIDGSCESPFVKNPLFKIRPTNDQDIINDIKYLTANINFESKTGNLLARLYHKKFLRNPDYKTNYTNAVIAQNKAKNKSRKHFFSVVNGPNKKTR